MRGAAHRVLIAVVALAATTLIPAHAAPSAAAAAPVPDRSVVTWAASADRLGEAPSDRSYRLVVRTSAGGSGMRIRVSNAFGDRPLVIGSAYAGLRRSGARLIAGSNRKLRFDRASSVTLAPGEIRYSDPLPGRTEAGSDLAISLYVRTAGGPATGHGMALQTSYATAGDHTAEERDDAYTEQVGSWFYLDAVSVDTGPGTGAVVTLGDSITDGWQSTTDKNLRWPDFLARRLHGAPGSTVQGVANAGISGNKVLADGAGQSALTRLDRDVLSLPGVRTVVLFEGVNDVKAHSGVTAAALTAGYSRIIDRAHAAGSASSAPPSSRTRAGRSGIRRGCGTHGGERVDPHQRRGGRGGGLRQGPAQPVQPAAAAADVRRRGPSASQRQGHAGNGGLDRPR